MDQNAGGKLLIHDPKKSFLFFVRTYGIKIYKHDMHLSAPTFLDSIMNAWLRNCNTAVTHFYFIAPNQRSDSDLSNDMSHRLHG